MKINIKKNIKTGNFFIKSILAIPILFGHSNVNILNLQNRVVTKKYLKKYFKKIDMKNYESAPVGHDENKIWICWFQGFDNAPNIVKKCVKSILENKPESYDVIFIAKNNLDNYHIPKEIIQKWESGSISSAQFSDYLRTFLLVNYGGLWLDATVYLSSQLPKYIFQSGLFLVHHSNYTDDITIKYNSWLIYSKPNNPVLKATLDVLTDYYLHEKKIREYFLWHIIVTEIINMFNKDIEHFISDYDCDILCGLLNKRFNEQLFDEIKSITSIHKLSYKNIESNNEDSFYHYLFCEDNINE